MAVGWVKFKLRQAHSSSLSAFIRELVLKYFELTLVLETWAGSLLFKLQSMLISTGRKLSFSLISMTGDLVGLSLSIGGSILGSFFFMWIVGLFGNKLDSFILISFVSLNGMPNMT